MSHILPSNVFKSSKNGSWWFYFFNREPFKIKRIKLLGLVMELEEFHKLVFYFHLLSRRLWSLNLSIWPRPLLEIKYIMNDAASSVLLLETLLLLVVRVTKKNGLHHIIWEARAVIITGVGIENIKHSSERELMTGKMKACLYEQTKCLESMALKHFCSTSVIYTS